MILGTIIQTTSHSVGQFIGARFLIGFGLTFAANAAPLLVTELAYPSQRAPLTSLYNCLWYSGAIVAAWTTYGSFRMAGSWSWRLPSALQGLPSVIQVCLMWFCPESPRWLIGHGRDAEALRILAYYHANGNDQDPLVQFEYNEIKEAIALDQSAKEQVSWGDLFKTPGNRRRMRIIIALAFVSTPTEFALQTLVLIGPYLVLSMVWQWSRLLLPHQGLGLYRYHRPRNAELDQRYPSGAANCLPASLRLLRLTYFLTL